MYHNVFVFYFDEKKIHLTFLHNLEDIFFPSTISILRTTEEFMPIKLGCSICGRIENIAPSVVLSCLSSELRTHKYDS